MRNSELVGQLAGAESWSYSSLDALSALWGLLILEMGAHVACSHFKYNSRYDRDEMLKLLGFLSGILSLFLFSDTCIDDGNVS